MSSKSPKIAALIQELRGAAVPAHYLGFFDCFNRQLFFEAHEVLEELWLEDRHGANGDFYKGLIQLAGAFVHLQKRRPGPAAALFNLAQANLVKYGPLHERLDLDNVLGMIRSWTARISDGPFDADAGLAQAPPQLSLVANALDDSQES